MRRIVYLTGTRADFGLMRSTLQMIDADPTLELGIFVTGMHLDVQYGDTVQEIEQAGLPIVARVPVALREDRGVDMARAIAIALAGMADCLADTQPDCLLLLGDRGEMLAGAIAALHMNIPIVHLHGGDRSGTVDEAIRHAISKLSHYHFTGTATSRERLIRMGERPEHIFVTGAPALDDICHIDLPPRAEFLCGEGFNAEKPVALVLFHPVVQQAALAREQTQTLLQALLRINGMQALILMPNADAGGESIREVWHEAAGNFRLVNHLPREHYHYWLAHADVLLGNSSSGIVEAASFAIPVVNVGDRQYLRERNANIIDTPIDQEAIHAALVRVLLEGKKPVQNIYGDGHAGKRIVKLLRELPFNRELLMKSNSY